jgi:hypothetical protein
MVEDFGEIKFILVRILEFALHTIGKGPRRTVFMARLLLYSHIYNSHQLESSAYFMLPPMAQELQRIIDNPCWSPAIFLVVSILNILYN